MEDGHHVYTSDTAHAVPFDKLLEVYVQKRGSDTNASLVKQDVGRIEYEISYAVPVVLRPLAGTQVVCREVVHVADRSITVKSTITKPTSLKMHWTVAFSPHNNVVDLSQAAMDASVEKPSVPSILKPVVERLIKSRFERERKAECHLYEENRL